MWTATLDLDPKRVLITQILRRFWSGASFSSFAPLQMQNLPRQPLPEKTWVRVRNRLAGICGSDLHMIQADGDLRIAPAALPLHRRSYPGHEVVGEVLEVGEDTQRIQVGDRVALQYGPNCLSSGVQTPCRSCAYGYYNLCEYGNLPGPHPIGGGWSEEMLLPEQQLFRIPTEISDEQAVVLEPTAVALHAVLRHLPQQNERVLIIGAGAIGLLTLQIVRALAPQAEVSVLARHSFQIEQATRQGAAHIIYPQDSYTGIQQATNAQMIKGALNNRVLLGGYDVVFDTVGSQKTLHHALRWARTQATVVLVGVNLHPMHIDLTPVWYQEINLIGSMGSSIENWPPATGERRSTFDIVVDLIKHDQIHPELLITHRFPLNNSQTALLTALHKEQNHSIKVLFDYSLVPPSVVPNIRASAPRKRRPRAIDEDTSLPESQNIASVPLPAQPAEPIVSLLPLLSSSRTVAPAPYDDELDEMEDTISAPAITKYNKQEPSNQQKEQPSIQPENNIPQKVNVQPEPEVVSLELIPASLTTEPENQDDEMVIPEVASPELILETLTIELENQVDEMVIPEVVSPELVPGSLTTEHENRVDETVIADDTTPRIDEEPSEINDFTDATKIDETSVTTTSSTQAVDETNDATPEVAEEPLHPLWENNEGRGITLRAPTSPETIS
ncbi:MAG: alcohol dehydrogenase catalytic domain-containing protein, partial [Ktedonobacteraceae bacterium]|nr:alcohol dehydrogenase catalytic domain-containing protein [Ktedonobacteraceae bacterium]